MIFPAQMPGTQDLLPAVLATLHNVGNELGTALRRPGMLAAAAAWDPDAVPALCILALGSASSSSAAASKKPSSLHSLLQPATIECLRYVIGVGSLLIELDAS